MTLECVLAQNIRGAKITFVSCSLTWHCSDAREKRNNKIAPTIPEPRSHPQGLFVSIELMVFLETFSDPSYYYSETKEIRDKETNRGICLVSELPIWLERFDCFNCLSGCVYT